MTKLIVTELVKMRRYWIIWAAILTSLGHSIYSAYVYPYEYVIAQNSESLKMEYVSFAYITPRWFSIVILMAVAYAIAEDFSMRTVQNALSVGISRKKYYVSRLVAQLVFVFAMFTVGWIAFIITRIIVRGEVNTAMPLGEFLTFFVIIALQMMVYASLASMISILTRRQAIAVAVSESWIFFAIVLRTWYISYRLNILYFIVYDPLVVIESMDDYLAAGIFTFTFLKFGISAIVIIAVTSIIGYVHFMRSDV